MTRVLRQMNSSLSRKQFLRGGAVGLLTLMSGIRIAFGEGKAIKVGFILPDFDQLRWKNGDQAGFEAEAKNLGISVVTVASQNSETIQSSQVEDMLTQGWTTSTFESEQARSSGYSG
jgi:D-xylose transport system substrate-binding protein